MTQINRDCLGCMSLENIYALFTITRNIQEVSARSYLFIPRVKQIFFIQKLKKVCGWIFQHYDLKPS